jgi:hypothetical protein
LPSIQSDALLYLRLATELGDRLLPAFDSPTGIPWSSINLGKRVGIPDKWNQGVASLAEAASLQLEMKYLSQISGDWVYWRKAEKVSTSQATMMCIAMLIHQVSEIIRAQAIHDGIAPIFISYVIDLYSQIRLTD